MLNFDNRSETDCTIYEIVHLWSSVNLALLMINMAENGNFRTTFSENVPYRTLI